MSLCTPCHHSWEMVCRRVVCADDKLAVMSKLQAAHKGWSVMCGDSLSDFSCLLAADTGILLGSSSSLRQLAAAAGIRLLPLDQGDARCVLSLVG